jgi:hypothetical protein
MAEMGHATPTEALRVYAQVMRRDEDEQEALRALVDGASAEEEEQGEAGFRQPIGSGGVSSAPEEPIGTSGARRESA